MYKIKMNILALILLLIHTWCASGFYTNRWAVHVPAGEAFAKRIAEENGFRFISKIVDEHYEFEHPRIMKRSADAAIDHHAILESHPHVHWVEQQIAKSRVKRDFQVDRLETRTKRDISFNDPKWNKMWYLRRPNRDMNVISAWQQGYTGKGSVVSILDDGIEKNHPDLMKNYDPQASYDVNNHDSDPQPRYDYTNFNRHGTRCAGEVAAEANNNICSVGVAYNAGIGGVRMLDGDVTDSVEAQSLAMNPGHIDIYSASWGPDDDGRTVDGPGPLAKKAFKDGITKGRNGKGSIFVWASGNGGRDHDVCSCDGYTNSIETLSVSSASENDLIPWYLEPCASTLATTYSSGGAREKQVITTDLRKGCTETHTGTSASAPLAAGIVALALEANPNLTWRDLQYVVLMTAKPGGLHANDWVTNAVGRRVSHAFGYGMMDAGAMTDLARRWRNVPAQHKCEINGPIIRRHISQKDHVVLTVDSTGCSDKPENKVVYLEHVQVFLDIGASRRGDLQMYLTSPQGTNSTLLQKRPRDLSKDGFKDWTFLTVHSWGEMAMGQWTLRIVTSFTTAEIRKWKLILYGTDVDPLHPGSAVPAPHPAQPSHDEQPVTPSEPVYNTSTDKGVPTVPPPFISQGNLKCDKDWYLLNNYCYKKCPEHFYPANETKVIDDSSSVEIIVVPRSGHNSTTPLPSGGKIVESKPICLMCDITCLECFGPSPDQCKTCPGGYLLTNNNTCIQYVRKNEHQDIGVLNIVIIVCVCVSAGAVFLLVFLCLQAREYGYFSPSKWGSVCVCHAESGKAKWEALDTQDSEEEEFAKAELLSDSENELY